jgi:hypothetical protein
MSPTNKWSNVEYWISADEELTLDVPEDNLKATCLAINVGLRPVFETARMYKGRPQTLIFKTYSGSPVSNSGNKNTC